MTTGRDAPGPWVHRLARVTAGGTLLLLVAGGLVTNTGAALAVPDWPTTFGHNLFLFPWSQMVGGVLVEHSHRLLGSVVGLLTVGLAVTVWLTDRRGWLRMLAALAVVLVCVQGLVGGLRVVWLHDTLAIVHGCVAQGFFALVVSLAVFTAPGWLATEVGLTASEARVLLRLAAAAAAALYAQIVLGAFATHASFVSLHLAGAVVAVTVAAALVAHVEMRHAAVAGLQGPARAIGALLAVQVALGLGAYVSRFTAVGLPGGEVAVIGLPVAHRAVGALLLGATVSLALHAWRLRPVAVAGAREPRGAEVLSGGVAA